MTKASEELLRLAERIFVGAEVRECLRSLRSGKDDWRFGPNGEAHRTRPYPMGFYVDDHNLYWARGWGSHERMCFWERRLVRHAALRTLANKATPHG